MHRNAVDSVHESAHDCTQLGTCSFADIDVELDYTRNEVTAPVYAAPMPVSLTGKCADSHTCTEMHLIQCMSQHMMLTVGSSNYVIIKLLSAIINPFAFSNPTDRPAICLRMSHPTHF